MRSAIISAGGIVSPRPKVVAVILAGGQSRRMGGRDKALLSLAGKPVIQHVADRLAGQTEIQIISANGDPARFASMALPVVADAFEGFAGPLAGILTGMLWTRQNATGATHIFSAPADTPFLPREIVTQLWDAFPARDRIVVAKSEEQLHHAVGLWPVDQADPLRQWLEESRERAVHSFLTEGVFGVVEIIGQAHDPFFNINTEDDLAEARQWAEEPA